jgi:hypothetical protein
MTNEKFDTIQFDQIPAPLDQIPAPRAVICHRAAARKSAAYYEGSNALRLAVLSRARGEIF